MVCTIRSLIKTVPVDRTQRPFAEDLPPLLAERGLTLRALARAVGVSDSHLSKVLRQVDYKSVSGDLATRVAIELGLPEDYFPETREAAVFESIRGDARLRDRL